MKVLIQGLKMYLSGLRGLRGLRGLIFNFGTEAYQNSPERLVEGSSSASSFSTYIVAVDKKHIPIAGISTVQ